MSVIINAQDKSRDFLISKGIITPDKSESVITYTDGRQVIVNDLLIEFAEMLYVDLWLPNPPTLEVTESNWRNNIEWYGSLPRPANQWGLND